MKKMKFSLQPETGTLSEMDAKRYFSRVGLSVAVLMVVYYAAIVLMDVAISSFVPWLYDYAIVSQLLSIVPQYAIAVPCFYAMLRVLPRDSIQPDSMGRKNFFVVLCIAIALMMAGNYIGNMVIVVVSVFFGATPMNPVAAETVGQTWWINLIFVGIVAPILEELVFRKMLCDRLLPLGEGYAVVLSAAIFGLVHGNFFQFFYAFALGAVFAFVYIKTGRVRYSMAYHSLINLTGGVLTPWLLERLEPVMKDEFVNELLLLANNGNVDALSALLTPHVRPLMILLVYDVLLMVAAICGAVFLFRRWKRIRLEKGLLPPPREGRVANVFCNVGVAAALTVFTGIFVLSLL